MEIDYLAYVLERGRCYINSAELRLLKCVHAFLINNRWAWRTILNVSISVWA